MRSKSFFTTLVLAALITLAGLFAPGCATIVPPLGGDKDTLAPILVRSSPANGTLNFDENRVVLTFDEYVDVENYQQNVIVSPFPSSFPLVTRKLNTIVVRLRDSLEQNQTYTINFGNSIRDINEGNVYTNFTYSFSTGDYIDSLQLRGNIRLAENGSIDTTLTVLLYQSSDDSAVLKTEPRYIAKTDGNGAFIFKNLPPDTFYVYALKSSGGSYQYRSKETLFAFADSAVVVGPVTKQVALYAYSVKGAPLPGSVATAPANRSSQDKRLKFSTSLTETQDLLKTFSFKFEVPLKTWDSTKIHFTRDSSFTPLNNYSFELDSTRKILTMQYAWEQKTRYSFILDKDFATDTFGQQLLRPDTITFNTKAFTDYGKLNLRFRNLDLSRKPVLQFIQNDQIINSFPLTSAILTKDLFLPGDYSLRILEDLNGNGIWDPGKFPERVQPELVKRIERTISIKPNSNIPLEIDVTAAPSTKPNTGQQVAPGQIRPRR